MVVLRNQEILTAINALHNPSKGGGQLKMVGGDTTITKKDVMDTIFLLMYFKKNVTTDANTQGEPEANKSSSVNAPAATNTIYDELATNMTAASLKGLINKVLTKINSRSSSPIKIDGGSSEPIIQHLHAKENLARIVYFLALDACDSLTSDKKSLYQHFKKDYNRYITTQDQTNNTTSTHSSEIATSFDTYKSIKIPIYKKLFLLASTLADNQIKNSILVEADAIAPVMYFFENTDNKEGIVKIEAALTDQHQIFENIVKHTYRGDNYNTIKFKTSTPKIDGAADITVNLRVIQTILIGNNVHTYNTDALKMTNTDRPPKPLQIVQEVADLANNLLSEFTIDIARK